MSVITEKKNSNVGAIMLWGLFVGLFLLSHFYAECLHWVQLPTDSPLAQNILLGVKTLTWLCGSLIVTSLVDLIIWDFFVARALGSAVPGVLKALGGVLILLATITCIVGLVFQQSVGGFLTALGAGGFALGLALRELFSDIFTGLAINLDRTFRIGEWIEFGESGRGTVGKIVEIGWRSTHLLTEAQKTVIIPNSNLGELIVTNVSRPSPPTRYQTIITLDFSVPVSRGKRVLLASLQAIRERSGFAHDREPEVLVGDVTENGLEYLLRYWILPWEGISPNRARDVVTTSAMEHLLTAGISPTYEKTDIYYRDMPLRNAEGHTREDQILLLSRIELFSKFQPDEIATLADAIVRHSYNTGDDLCVQGEPGDSLFILTEGLLDVLVSSDGGLSKQRVARLLPGDFVGEMALLTGEPRSATICAVTPCVAYEIKGDALRGLLDNRPAIADILSQVVAQRKHRNAETLRVAGMEKQSEEINSFAAQVLTRMLGFLKIRR